MLIRALWTDKIHEQFVFATVNKAWFNLCKSIWNSNLIFVLNEAIFSTPITKFFTPQPWKLTAKKHFVIFVLPFFYDEEIDSHDFSFAQPYQTLGSISLHNFQIPTELRPSYLSFCCIKNKKSCVFGRKKFENIFEIFSKKFWNFNSERSEAEGRARWATERQRPGVAIV